MELLIVDDEESALEAVLQNTDWSAIPFTQIYTATNIEQAKVHLENPEIRVVLCDIEMPMGSGLDLLEWINGNRADVVCIFMTCHAEFSYAQQAIRLGSLDYILKPLDFNALALTLQEAVKRIQEQSDVERKLDQGRKAVEQQFWRKLFAGDIALNRGEIQYYIEKNQLDLTTEGRFLPMMVLPYGIAENMTTDERKLMLFALNNVCTELFLQVRPEMRSEVMADGRLLLMFHLSEGEAEEDVTGLLEKQIRLFPENVENYLNMHVFFMIGQASEIEEVPEQLEDIYDLIYHYWRQDSSMAKEGLPYLYIRKGVSELRQKRQQNDSPVGKIIEYINENLGEELSVDSLAKLVYLNADYLNRIFKKETGYTISNYVIGKKMEHAKWLLKNTDLPIRDVAGEVGYFNYSSFNRSFKKMTGKSPQDWKLGQ